MATKTVKKTTTATASQSSQSPTSTSVDASTDTKPVRAKVRVAEHHETVTEGEVKAEGSTEVKEELRATVDGYEIWLTPTQR